MRILVTGGTGFTGSHLVRRLLDRGHNVLVLDIEKGFVYDELKARGAKIELGSITAKSLVEKLMRDCEVVYHLAAAFRQLNLSNRAYWSINVEGTRNLLETAYKFGVRKFIYCSSVGVHGNVKNPPANEESPISPEDYYQLTKYEAEKVAQEYVERGLDIVTIRPAAIYGPGDSGRFLILFRLIKKGYFLMFGAGNTFYHPVYIDNLLDAFELAADKEGISGQKYIIGDDHYYSLNELVQHVASALGITVRIKHVPFRPLWIMAFICENIYRPLGLPPPLFRRRVDWFRQNRAFDVEKAKNELNYKPKITLEEGLSRTARWYLEHGYL